MKFAKAMQMLVLLQLLVLFGIMDNSVAVNAETGFVSFMCGASSDYFSQSDGISWTSDAAYAPPISKAFSLPNQASLLTLRAFPPDASSPSGRSCFSNLVPPSLSLVRATFAYGNYDSLNKPPVFGVSIGATMYSTINLNVQDPWVEEIILNADQEQAFCLIAMDGIPVISLLELRPLPPRSYNRASSSLGVALKKVYRIDCGSEAMKITRYPDDRYDRIWDPDHYYLDGSTTSTHSISRKLKTSAVTDDCPLIVLQSNRFNYHNQTLSYSLPLSKPNGKYLMNAYFGELYNTTGPTFIMTVNGAVLTTVVGWPPLSGAEFTATQAASSWWNISLLPVIGAPQINGLEVYEIIQLMHVSNQRDARALNLIELNFNIQNVLLDWALGSDPCFPVPWRGVICNTGSFQLATIRNASGNNLVGHVQNLTKRFQSLRDLDLSDNQLSGTLDVFATLNLHYLNIANNQFSGPLPGRLTQPGLVVITSGNPCIQYGSTDPCVPSLASSTVPQSVERNAIRSSKHYSKSVITGVVMGISAAVLAIAAAGFTGCRRYKLKRELINAFQEAGTVNILEKELTLGKNAKRFSFLELENATNRFKQILGEGNLGLVFRGRLQDGTDVAIKMRADGLQLDADSFLNEVSLLSKVRHQNLVLLIGFCLECKKQLLVFEFMSGGSLKDHLYGPLSKIQPMSWEQRLTSVIGAAVGLEHLHRGCEFNIIHRNVKSSNILLGPNYFSKVADFCLSKPASHNEKSLVGGTAGYLDPEYFNTSQLTDRSDVFSFGVVLMEILCGREPLSSDSTPEEYNLVAWVRPALQDDIPKGDTSVVDKALRNQFVLQSLAIVANVALQCTEKEGANRPSMTQVVRELRRAADIELLLPTGNKDSSSHQSLQSTSGTTTKHKTYHSAELYPTRSKNISQIR
ncbi:probable LRR receptor-like serine/threonine-protein kinase At5g48740 isoform X5 [Physcomitrium patens]|uniref:probable LRR receptor-like serine/threonine-protein kinase At5g48740 isoform X5 n=1 Tax=Physcomitrium patens TaxID=3218 RepID=UPI000D15C230|nr:probable LRR receptor-like serine/threonine-protein kinase At5g48740 isoform X3 [Physcomitrium patens]|eukprot:XP_024371320.1 probable LRR receptor-like serine/threonine-protein kinase At5g48740 isoform X3 [Physcomitrella patens]